MPKYLSLLLFTALLACQTKEQTKQSTKLESNFSEIDSAFTNFPAGKQFFLLKTHTHSTLMELAKTETDGLFSDRKMNDSLIKQISAWLRDSVYVRNTKHVNFVLSEEITAKSYRRAAGIMQIPHDEDVAIIDGNEFSFGIVPSNGQQIAEFGSVKITTQGSYIASPLYSSKSSEMQAAEYDCKELKIDWYITVSSSKKLERDIAIKFSDTALYFDADWKGELLKRKND